LKHVLTCASDSLAQTCTAREKSVRALLVANAGLPVQLCTLYVSNAVACCYIRE